MRGPEAGATAVYGAAVRPAADRLDHPQRHLPLPAHGADRAVRRLRDSIAGITPDRRCSSFHRVLVRRLLLGCGRLRHAGGGDGRDADGPRFSPLAAAGLSLIATTAPVALRRARRSVIALSAVTGLDLIALSANDRPAAAVFPSSCRSGDQGVLPAARACWRSGQRCSWPVISFAVPQYLVSNFHGPWLVDVVRGRSARWRRSPGFLRVWQPARIWTATDVAAGTAPVAERRDSLPRHGVPRLAALADPVAVRLRLGQRRSSAPARRPLGVEDAGALPAQPRLQDAAGCAARVTARPRSIPSTCSRRTGTGILLSRSWAA